MSDMFDSNVSMCTSRKDAMAMCIHALMIQQCNPIFWVAHLGLKVLKIDHYYQKNNDYRPYLILHLHVGPSNLVPSPFAFDPRKNGKQEVPVTLKPRLENNHFLATEVGMKHLQCGLSLMARVFLCLPTLLWSIVTLDQSHFNRLCSCVSPQTHVTTGSPNYVTRKRDYGLRVQAILGNRRPLCVWVIFYRFGYSLKPLLFPS